MYASLFCAEAHQPNPIPIEQNTNGLILSQWKQKMCMRVGLAAQGIELNQEIAIRLFFA